MARLSTKKGAHKKARPKNKANKIAKLNRLLDQAPFPQKQIATFHYSDNQTISAPTGSFDYHQMRLNSIYDPDQTGVGASCPGVNAYLGAVNSDAPYDAYKVFLARCTVTVYPNPSNTVPTKWGIIAHPTGHAVSTLTWEEVESNDSKYTTYSCLIPGSTEPQTLSLVVPVKKLFNVKNLDDEDWYALYNTNPSNQATFTVYAQALDNVASVPNTYTIKVDYVAMLAHRHLMNFS